MKILRIILFCMVGLFAELPIASAEISCELSQATTAYWSAIDEEVIINADIKPNENGLSLTHISLKFFNGRTVSIGAGNAFIFIYRDSNSPSCQEQLASTIEATIDSLEGRFDSGYILREPETLADFAYYSELAQSCQYDVKDKDIPAYCDEALYYNERHQESISQENEYVHAWPDGRYDLLVKEKAPLIHVTGSSYNTTTFVYDRIDNIIRYVHYDGC